LRIVLAFELSAGDGEFIVQVQYRL